MRSVLIFIGILAACCPLYGDQPNSFTVQSCPNIGLFRLETLKTRDVQGSWVREGKLTLVRQLKGRAPDSLTFRATIPVVDSVPDVFGRVVVNDRGGLFHPMLMEGVELVLGYREGIENVGFIEVGNEYAEDIAFLGSLPETPDLAAIGPRLDQFLPARRGRLHRSIASYLAASIASSDWDENLLNAYVRGNPLKLMGEARSEMFQLLAGWAIESDMKTTKKDAKVWVDRTNFVTSEIVGLISTEEGLSESKVEMIRILRTLIRQVRFRMTPETLKEVDELLKSDKVSDSDRKVFENDKAHWKTEKDREGGR
jgi:hypothetical protein